MVLIHLSAPVRPTELPQRVQEAVTRFFPDAEVQVAGDEVRATANDLAALRSRIWELRIIDTFRGKALHGITTDGQGTVFALSKQAAFAGKISFPPTPHALGDLRIEVTVEEGDPWPDAEALCWWLCPETREGEIVGPVE